MRYTLLIVAALVLGACGQQTYGVTCPEVKSYTQEELLTAAAELSQSNLPVTNEMIADYLKLRDAAKVCQQWQESPR